MNKQDEKLIKSFLHETENVTETNIELFWILPPLLYSKKVFRKRSDLENFILNVLNMEFANYVFRSRPLLVGRVVKKIHLMEIEDSVNLRNNLINFLRNNIETKGDKNPEKDSEKDGFFSDWATLLKQNN